MRNGYLMGLNPIVFSMTFPKVLLPLFDLISGVSMIWMKLNQTLTRQKRGC